jgi:hypothetical protein
VVNFFPMPTRPMSSSPTMVLMFPSHGPCQLALVGQPLSPLGICATRTRQVGTLLVLVASSTPCTPLVPASCNVVSRHTQLWAHFQFPPWARV